jgi:RNA polymerase sigma factor (sigma-70 family)
VGFSGLAWLNQCFADLPVPSALNLPDRRGVRTSVASDFDRLFRTEYPRLVRALTLACGDAELAADAAQDAFLQAHRHWRRVSGYLDPAAWLRRVAISRLANRRRGVRRLQGFVARTPPEAGVAAPHDVAGSLDLRAAVAELSRQQRLAVALHYLLDLPVSDVAHTLGVAPATVRSHLHSARKALAGALDDDDSPLPRRRTT